MMKKLIAAALLALPFMLVLPDQALGQQNFCFPTCDTTDGRFLGMGSADTNTLSPILEIRLAVEKGSNSFSIGFFDGDTGKSATNPALVSPSAGNWDAGTGELTYRLFADPTGDGSGTTLIARWFGNSINSSGTAANNPLGLWIPDATSGQYMPNNDWWGAIIDTSDEAQSGSGHYFYNLKIELDPNAVGTISDFKVRSTGLVALRPVSWGFEGSLRQVLRDGRIILPDWDGTVFNTPGHQGWLLARETSTYDGTWTFFLDIPTDLTDLTIYDGDMDYGYGPPSAGQAAAGYAHGEGIPSKELFALVLDTDDPDSAGIPAFAAGTAATSESAKGHGSPGENSPLDFFRRGDAITYTLIDPNGNEYKNLNPSGNLEWEQFTITTVSGIGPSGADYGPDFDGRDGVTRVVGDRLPKGIWTIRIDGMDLSNTNFWRFGFNTLGVPEDCDPNNPTEDCFVDPPRPFEIGDTVWFDQNSNGVQDAGEPGIANVLMKLKNGGQSIIDTTTTDSQGHYMFEVEAGHYTVMVGTENFLSGGPLAGMSSTNTTGNQLENTVVSANIDTYDFGYLANLFAIGDQVWIDSDGDNVFEPEVGELGIPGVKVQLWRDDNGDGVGDVKIGMAETSGDGSYIFNGVSLGRYEVRVNSTSVPSRLSPSFDFDGLATPHSAALNLTGDSFVIDFAYRPTTPTGTGTIGFWQNHPGWWPVQSITIGKKTFSKIQAMTLLKAATRGDKLKDLSKQLIATKLNVGMGTNSSCIESIIRDADAWLSQYQGQFIAGSSSEWRIEGGRKAHFKLDSYNNGKMCAPSRD